MRILHIINVRWFNATAWYAFRLAKGAKKAGDEAALAGLPGSPVINMAKEEEIETFEGDFNSNNAATIFRNFNRLRGFIKKFQPDAVVCHRGEMFWLLALYKYFGRKPWKFIRVRGDIRPPTTDILSRFTHNVCADRIITSGEFIRKQFIENLKSPENHVKTVYGGVDTEVFRPDSEARNSIRWELGFAPEDFVVSVVGRFDPIKGHNVFLKACGILYREGMKNLRVLLAGFPENVSLQDIENMIEENGLKGAAFITGKREDVAALMNACDLGVISSLGSEAICRVVMEFMACGVPAVSSDAGVLPEMLPPENVYPMKDPQALAEKIKNHKDFTKIYSERDFYSLFLQAAGLA